MAVRFSTLELWHAQSCLTLRPHGLQPTRRLCPWDFLGKNTGMSYHFLLQGIFPTQGWNLGLLHPFAGRFLTTAPPGKASWPSSGGSNSWQSGFTHPPIRVMLSLTLCLLVICIFPLRCDSCACLQILCFHIPFSLNKPYFLEQFKAYRKIAMIVQRFPYALTQFSLKEFYAPYRQVFLCSQQKSLLI